MNNNIAFVLGNGESRNGIKIEDLKKHGKVYACNAVFRTDRPDFLVAVDPKMMLEIAETDYALHNEVWTNFNAQYNKQQKILDNVKWFQPSLGWSSGPTALRMACDRKHPEIYILGFDYAGHQDSKKTKRNVFNNLFKNTRNYKKTEDEATFYGNWMSQTKHCLQDFKDTKFFRIVSDGNIKPKDLEWQNNLKHVPTEEFLSKFNLEIKYS